MWRKWYLWLAVMGLFAIMQGCGSVKTEQVKDLVVVEQIDSICGVRDGVIEHLVSFDIDVPVDGSQALVDSVMAFVNSEVYNMCEFCVDIDYIPEGEHMMYNKKEMFTNDGPRLLSHYMDKYKPLIQDSLENTYGLELKLVAQTEKYVTYGMESLHCGGSCGSEKFYHTFDKTDGHQVTEIISHDNLLRFFADNPEYNNFDVDPWSDEQGWEFTANYDFCNSYCGLLNDHFTLVINGVINHYMVASIPYSRIFSYLSPEAQTLVKQEGEGKPMLPPYLPERSEDGEVQMEPGG